RGQKRLTFFSPRQCRLEFPLNSGSVGFFSARIRRVDYGWTRIWQRRLRRLLAEIRLVQRLWSGLGLRLGSAIVEVQLVVRTRRGGNAQRAGQNSQRQHEKSSLAAHG